MVSGVDDRQQTIAFVLPSLDGGGAERVTLNYLAGLKDADLRLVLISFVGADQHSDVVPAHVEHIALGPGRLRATLLALVRTLFTLRPDIIYSTIQHTNVAILALSLLMFWRPKIIIREPNLPSRQLPALNFSRFLKIAYRLLYPKADKIVAPSQQIISELIRDFRISPGRTDTLANPIKEHYIRQLAAPVKRAPGPGLRLVSAGSLTLQKGFDRLLRSFADMPADSHLTILGAGPLERELRDLAAKLECADRIIFAGFMKNPWPYFAGADAFLLASKWEGMPNVALEALACGVPVIGSREAGGLVEIAEEVGADSVILAEPGAEMNGAMALLVYNEAKSLRPSRLPDRFSEDAATKAFAKILMAL